MAAKLEKLDVYKRQALCRPWYALSGFDSGRKPWAD